MFARKRRYLFLFAAGNFIFFVSSCLAPSKSFDNTVPPPEPDYSKEVNWAALPDKKDSADIVPKNSGLTDNQSTAQVDVFFIHPTSYFKNKSWNAYMDDEKLNRSTDNGTIRNQASVFNGSCRIYAPRYRQATLYSFNDKAKEDGKKALDFAYEDVKTAFKYYLKHYNNGRPIIIASHSQGSRHAFQLIKDFFENDPVLYKQLVCAYIIGMNTETDYTTVMPCDSASQTGCMVSWRTARWGTEPNKTFFRKSKFCTNPLSWKTDTMYVSNKNNKGAVRFGLTKTDPYLVDAKVHDNILWVHKPKEKGYLAAVKNYHLIDYNLFYMDIRENVKLRVDTYLKAHGK